MNSNKILILYLVFESQVVALISFSHSLTHSLTVVVLYKFWINNKILLLLLLSILFIFLPLLTSFWLFFFAFSSNYLIPIDLYYRHSSLTFSLSLSHIQSIVQIETLKKIHLGYNWKLLFIRLILSLYLEKDLYRFNGLIRCEREG